MPAPWNAASAADHSVEADGFAPLEALRNAIRFWWLIALLVAAGGLAGWLLHRTRPPLYEAVGRFSSSIDYVSTGPMTQFEEDTALNAIGDLVYSNPIAQKVADRLSAEGLAVTVLELKRTSALERKLTVWELRVRAANPRDAEHIAKVWVEVGQAALLENYQHALRADQLSRYLHSLENCLAQSASAEPFSVQCSQARFSEIQADLRDAGAELARERLLSGGLFSGLTIGAAESELVSEQPVQYGQNQLVLAGALIGMLVGIAIVQLGIPARLRKRS